MNQIDAVYQSVLESPDDQLHRLALADALQDYGTYHQISLGEYMHHCLNAGGSQGAGPSAQQVWNWYGKVLQHAWPGTSDIVAMPSDIEARNEYEYEVHFYAGAHDDNFRSRYPTSLKTRTYKIVLKDGLVAGIKCSFKAWLKNAGTACQFLPITQVSITDRYAIRTYRNHYSYYLGDEYRGWGAYIAPPVFNLLYKFPGLHGSDRHRSYPSLKEALEYLSWACVSYGRSFSKNRPQLSVRWSK